MSEVREGRRGARPARVRPLALAICLVLAGALNHLGAAPGPPCRLVLTGQDAAGQTIFRTVALPLAGSGLVAAPLHVLERGGVRWERLMVGMEGMPDQDATKIVSVAALDPAGDFAYLEAPGLPGCALEPDPAGAGEGGLAQRSLPQDTMAVLVLRERSGYRPAQVGGRVERVIDLPNRRRLILARLLDGRGADPGLLLDADGGLIGSVAPSPAGCDPGLVVAIVATLRIPPPGDVLADRSPRLRIPPRSSPSISETLPGLVSEALLLAGSGRTEPALLRLDEALRRGGESAALLLERGVLHYAAGHLPAAIADLSGAAQADPTRHLARFNLGMALGASGRYADAAEAFRQARDLAPDHARTRFQLALALKAAHLGAAVQAEVESLDRLDPTLGRELRIILGF